MMDSAALWASLPVPAFLIDAGDKITDVNAAGEGFLNTSRKALVGQPVWDTLAIDAPVEEAFARAREQGTPLFVNDIDVGSGSRAPLQCGVQIASLQGQEGVMLLMVTPRELAGRMTQTDSAKSAAASAIGMAEMLAHEIKNPLAGITGAAQLLSMNLAPEDLELTDLIVSESRRIVKLLEQVEQFGNLTEPGFKPVNLHDVLDKARRSALLGFGARMTITEEYDPSLPMAWGGCGPAASGGAELAEKTLRKLLNQKAELFRSEPFMSIPSVCAEAMAQASCCRCRSRFAMMGRGCLTI